MAKLWPRYRMTNFNWRDYIEIDDEFGADKPLIEKTMDSIAAAEPDGQELIRAMYTNTGKKIQIIAGPQNAADALGGSGKIALNLEALKKIVVNTPEGKKHISLTGAIVHEMFHIADHKVRAQVIRQLNERHKFGTQNLTDEQHAAVKKAFDKMVEDKRAELPVIEVTSNRYQNIKPDEFIKITQDELIHDAFRGDPKFLTILADTAGVPQDSFTCPFIKDPALCSEKWKIKLKAILDECEQTATQYTDVFMAKHFPGEPWRGNYENAGIAEDTQLILRELGCGTFKPNVYQPQEACLSDLGVMARQPVITSTPRPGCQTTKVKH